MIFIIITHVIFHLDNGELYYSDVRQFGWVKIIKSEELLVNNFAPEPLKDLTLEIFSRIISSSKRNVKVLLMDQTKIGGIGNIYANDALWLSRISPKRTSNSLSDKESKLLFDAIITVLKAGLKYGGASELTFVNAIGQEGEYQNHFLAYGKKGQKCSICGGLIEKIFLGGRGTFFCPKHQK